MKTDNAIKTITDLEIIQGLKDPAKAEGILETLKECIDSIVTSFKEMKDAALESQSQAEASLKIAKDNAQAVNDLTTSIKHIHIALNAHADVLPEDLRALNIELAKFVLSGPAIKVGVIEEAKREN